MGQRAYLQWYVTWGLDVSHGREELKIQPQE